MRPPLVVDSSIALGWSLHDEYDDDADMVLADVERRGAIVPVLFWYEITNVLALLVRRNRIAQAHGTDIGLALDALDIVSIPPGGAAWRTTVSELASRHQLSVYDAAYLHLALDREGSLATSDRALYDAAQIYDVAFARTVKPKDRR